MKKASSLILALVLCLSLCACGGRSDAPETTTTKPLTAKEQLTDLEETLFNILIAMTTESFYEPSAVRVLEVCDYEERTKYENTDSYDVLYGPDTIVVRLQGENKVGGTLNHYYLICLKTAENKSDYGQSMITLHSGYFGEKADRMRCKAEKGEYAELSDYYKPKADATDLFDSARINKALKEYWEEMGF